VGTVKTKDNTQLYYKDWGSGQLVVFSHGWALNVDAWDDQMFFLAAHGFRTSAHDRRGHGRSSQPASGHDQIVPRGESYDTQIHEQCSIAVRADGFARGLRTQAG
jgi:pimeloyl-ACP methyl ester carboxylesterase